MARVVISDGIALIKLSPVQRYLLKRPHIAFELARMVGIYLEMTPKRRDLGVKSSKGWFFWTKTGEYQAGVKKILFLGRRRGTSVRILMLNPAFDEFFLSDRKSEEIAAFLRSFLKNQDFSQK